MGDIEKVTVQAVSSIAEIDAESWDACAFGSSAPDASRGYNPFVSHAFLKALEESGSAAMETGWLPRHLLLQGPDGELQGAMPCYVKSHSQGEYVFDHGWADAFERAGGAYYPKLQSAVPFTPVTGPRLLVPDCPDKQERQSLLLQAGASLTNQLELSSLHITFLTEEEWKLAGQIGYLQRTDQQFHWQNEGYASFDDFLSVLASRKRKALKKERREAVADGIETEWITGADLTEAHWDAFFEFYQDTGARKWGRPYLNRRFFSLVSEAMPERIVLMLAKRDGNYIAGALNFAGGDTLYGRYWGCAEHHPFLHFELCYYQAIDFAIERGLARVEAGAQGEHKLARGYLPTPTYSAHYFRDASLAAAVSDYLRRERRAVSHEIALLSEESPFKKSDTDKI
ncbi:GNAT family N-acetyltransferase [Methyloligella sp. 2.7D]|uniref:GNAT family N-acetyltransferase n=1 Tax=unclassified Methyloligella TaxID=2625955 RepID=UPI00157CFD98|nr:GNAT family N-acetyltransferase [Methyloligella sp. GL2]QKP77416.1 N-acetyltransferase [Methyloligella sp. GL2]